MQTESKIKSIPCFKHEGSFILFINIGKQNTEFVCDECCVDLKALNSDQELIHIKNALRSPEFFISKLNISSPLKEYLIKLDKCNEQAMKSILKDFETKITDIQEILKGVYQELKCHVESILNKKQKIREELQKIIQFDKFTQFAINFIQLGDQINQEAIEQNEQILHEYLKDLTKNNCQELNQKLIEMLDRIKREPRDPKEEQYPQYRKLEEQFKQLNAKQIEFAKQISLINFGQFTIIYDSKFVSNQQSQKIINIIQSKLNKKVTNFSQIYLETRDGLNGQAFWNKVNGKSNLLMIFKSKSGYIFGGFSPCQWNQNLNNYVQDNTMSSFLFSQTHDQIYPLKDANKQNAIYCHQSYVPYFGSGDIYIAADFQNGSSNLGNSYQCDQYQITNKNTHLFGQTTPNIVECEIYQVILT
ncbi:unnamed protein product [Paramecium pentaurelia]|uniref:TLDc domain-containing protein n=1 Tax=Paramecium pentaurelia TaxID=43138 RepID=A0A8S1XL35_9CILI|nr:unnamed protein product [Paramecium pentaurelia]